ncbi:zinc-dependent alcohol dehydrogenase family protein [Marinicella sp. W31]|uniref:zinc-dependent alcohol dehydrogenase family protein n=1 Tax=Marinicella sp. W31 TaxID=3023713 RepID=UPI003756B72D
MKSVQFTQLGMPADVLRIEDIAMPEPAAGEVRIKVSTCNINPSDVFFIQGTYGIQPQLPSSAGFEAAGTIDACGADVDLPVGMRVIFSAMGVWQEYVTVPASIIVPVPENMSDDVACQAFINPYTAFGMLQQADLQAGQWLMLTAGGSAFGQLVIQLCQQRGINTICTVRRDDAIDYLKELGATEVVNTEKQDLLESVNACTQGAGVNGIFDAVGGPLAAQALDCLAANSTMYVFGLMSLKNIPLNSGLMIFKNLTVKGFWLTSWLDSLNTAEKIEVTQQVLGMLAQQKLSTTVEARYALEDIHKAIEHAESPGRKGKIILDLNS